MIICGTGHRPDKLGGFDLGTLLQLKDVAKDWIKNSDTKLIISGMALGWDQAIALAAIDLRIPFHAAVPFIGQESKWPSGSQQRYHTILSKATLITHVCDSGYASWKMQKRNQFMVDESDAVLALYNGTPGGTRNCLVYAEKQNKPIINLWDQFVKQS